MDPDAERSLVAGLRRCEAGAFDRVYAEYRGRVYGFLARMAGRRDLAEDLLQETFVRLASKAPGLAEDTRLAPWLFTVARNLFVSHRRWTALDAERLDQAVLAAGEGRAVTPFEEVASSETQRRLEGALAALPHSYREVLLLVAVERLEPAEAAAVLGIRGDALRQRLSRARAMLQTALAEPAPARRAARRTS